MFAVAMLLWTAQPLGLLDWHKVTQNSVCGILDDVDQTEHGPGGCAANLPLDACGHTRAMENGLYSEPAQQALQSFKSYVCSAALLVIVTALCCSAQFQSSAKTNFPILGSQR